MRFCLRIAKRHGEKEHLLYKRFNFTVIDLEKADEYPLNYVCSLPQLKAGFKSDNVFVKKFGSNSHEIAQILLQKALKEENNPEIKKEIEKRLKLLEPKSVVEKTCVKCGRTFQTTPRQAHKRKHCPECCRKRALERGQIFPDVFSGI